MRLFPYLLLCISVLSLTRAQTASLLTTSASTTSAQTASPSTTSASTTTSLLTTYPSTTSPSTTSASTTSPLTTSAPTTSPLTTSTSTTSPLTTSASTTSASTTTSLLTTSAPTTSPSTTSAPTTSPLTTSASTTSPLTTSASTTSPLTTSAPTTSPLTTSASTTSPLTTSASTTSASTTTSLLTTSAPTTSPSTTSAPTTSPLTTSASTTSPLTTSAPTTSPLTTSASTTSPLTTSASTTSASTTTSLLTTSAPTTSPSTTSASTTSPLTTSASTTSPLTTSASTTSPLTTSAPTTSPSTTSAPTTSPLTTSASTTSPLTTSASTTSPLTTSASTTLAAALAIFYPFGSTAGDTERFINYNESYDYVAFSTPFSFFGRTYNHTYVNDNGLLTFNQPSPEAQPSSFPTYGTEDYIAPLWTDLNDFGMGVYSYQQYTNGSVLTRATRDINRYFPQRAFTASWVFVATWDFVQTRNTSVFNLHSAPAITFQVVLISGGGFSFILMNYGDCVAISFPVEAGYDTVNSTDFFQIHYSTNGSSIQILKNTTNVNIPGRWAFLVNHGSAPEIFYPFGSSEDTRNTAVDDGGSSVIQLSSPFLFFDRTYQQIYVNNNGHLTFNQASSEFIPYSFPANGNQDIIAGLWTDLDNRERGVISYRQYTSGYVITRATQDINTHFPNLSFNASWVFVATWDKVAYFSLTTTETSFQVVLISGHNYSFILMNYGDIAVTGHPVQAGYDTMNSTHYSVIPGSNNGSFISNLRNSSNVNVPGRWAFRVDSGSKSNKEYIIGLQAKLSSFSDLTDTGNIQIVLQQIKQELVKYGLPNSVELKLRKAQKIKP